MTMRNHKMNSMKNPLRAKAGESSRNSDVQQGRDFAAESSCMSSHPLPLSKCDPLVSEFMYFVL